MVETSEEYSDWEVIQHPSNHKPSSPPPPHGRLLGYELVIRDNFYDDSSSIFPPSEHEDLPLLGEDSTSPGIMSPSSSACSDTGLPNEQQMDSDSRISVIMNEIGIRMYSFGRRMFQVFLCSSSRRCSSIFPAAVMVVALFASMKILLWRNRLLLLIREKDQMCLCPGEVAGMSGFSQTENQPTLASDSPHERDLVSKTESSSVSNQIERQQHGHPNFQIQFQLQ